MNLTYGDVWFNARPQLGARGVAEGQSLAELLGDTAAHLPWNVACGQGPMATAGEGEFKEIRGVRGTPKITLLSPAPEQLRILSKTWSTSQGQ